MRIRKVAFTGMGIVLIIVFTGTACFSQNDTVKNILYKTSAFSIQYPSSWRLDTPANMLETFLLFSPQEDAHDDSREHINLIIGSALNLSLDDLMKKYIEEIKKASPGVIIESNDKLEKHKMPYYKVVFSSGGAVYRLQFERHVYVKQNKAYILTFTAEPKHFERYSKIKDPIMASFTVK